MKGRLLPNLEVHRSLQAPSSGCSRNPETERAGVTARVPPNLPRTPRWTETAPSQPSDTCPQTSQGVKRIKHSGHTAPG